MGERLAGVPTAVGNLAAIWSPGRAAGLQLKADWHYVGGRLTEAPRDRITGIELPDYNYFNFGVGYLIAGSGTRLNVDLLNAFQSKGLEEGNPRIVSGAPTILFLSRPILPRRLQASVSYVFGGGRGPQSQPQ